ncbi:transcription/translation regulatory transformer protein RfaH [Shewanella yunxiaonensis]|uniref:Transcription antitermination protein RfaH n=1 Tax=Shewanella yunxiaonensis TaxID=2829809 RepID=A0ABX7YW20_9GAMM|nr:MULTISPECIES: transcription/translation regulatory transformer protein RfaH [Shewanella]MDF0533007.1 transcription/translation regulatory transformer protein RfaH [Shewanella sp. A32]QUN06884.1 transcription/translation regulatory transformer protein RfaH [Shewanella yunxiaonensis]
MKAWYLLYCKPRSEVRAQQHLTMQQLETYLPMLRMEKKEKGLLVVKKQPLFPNYLFIKFDPTITSVRQLHSTRGVARLVNCREELSAIDERLISHLKYREMNEPIVVPKALANGDKVKFTDGPFADLEGVFQEQCGDKRCRILFNFLGQMQSLIVDKTSLISAVCA